VGDAAFDLESLFFKIIRKDLRGSCFEEGRFGETPDLVAQAGDLGLMLFDGGDGLLFFLEQAAED